MNRVAMEHERNVSSAGQSYNAAAVLDIKGDGESQPEREHRKKEGPIALDDLQCHLSLVEADDAGSLNASQSTAESLWRDHIASLFGSKQHEVGESVCGEEADNPTLGTVPSLLPTVIDPYQPTHRESGNTNLSAPIILGQSHNAAAVSEIKDSGETMESESFHSAGAEDSTLGTILCRFPAVGDAERKDGGESAKRKYRHKPEPIKLETLASHFGQPLAEAANSLNVSRSTLKRICRTHGIGKWPSRGKTVSELRRQSELVRAVSKRNPLGSYFKNFEGESGKSPCSDKRPVVYEQALGRLVTLKVKYEDDIIKFRICSTSGIIEVKNQIAKRLGLKADTFHVKYKDEEDEHILIACDEDWQYFIDASYGLDKDVVRLLIELK